MGQLAKQIAENSSSNFGANTKKNPNEECKAIMTRSRKANLDEDEGRISDDQELVAREEEKEEEEEDQLREKKINDGEKERNEEKEKEKEKEEKNEKKIKRKREKGRQRVSLQEKRRKRLSRVLGRKHHTLWCHQRKTMSDIWLVSLISSRNCR